MDESSLFNEAREIADPIERAKFLEHACQGDSEKIRRIEALLAADADETGLADWTRDLTDPTTAGNAPRTGSQIGPYKLLQVIGEGGMGVVYMARQETPIERLVALKVIKPGLDSKSVIARFEAERQALARMDHPNIARVFDGGTTEIGHPFFVMELVKGVPITSYCDEHRLTTAERLKLFVQVCHAVQHAHQKGIIHRDIKPSNVLVAEYDDRAVPKVIDFGVAKAIEERLTDKTLFTAFGQIVGTIDYMSPEQTKFNQLDVDTRTDIYSLGVLLYELLTGLTPFDRERLHGAAIDQWMKIIREEDPPRPSLRAGSSETLPAIASHRKVEPRELSRQLNGDLDWIVMKSLEKERVRRYETANGLAADLQRHLDDEPVLACPPSAAYRFRKFAKRNRVGFLLASVASIAILIITVGSLFAAKRFSDQAKREIVLRQRADSSAANYKRAEKRAQTNLDTAREERSRAVIETKRALDHFNLARDAVDQFLSSSAENELASVPGMQSIREQLLSSALTFYEELVNRGEGGRFEREIARAHQRIALIHKDLNQLTESQRSFDQSIALYKSLLEQNPDDIEVLSGLAISLFYREQPAEALEHCLQALKIDPRHLATRNLLGDIYNAQALAIEEGPEPETLRLHRKAYAIRESVMLEHPEDPSYAGKLGGTINNIGLLKDRAGDRSAALSEYMAAAKHLRVAFDASPQTLLWGDWLCNALGNAASLENRNGNPERAGELLQELVAVRRRAATLHPLLDQLKVSHFRSLQTLAKHFATHNRVSDQRTTLRQMKDTLESMPRQSPSEMLLLASIYADLSQPAGIDRRESATLTVAQKEHGDLAMQWIDKAIKAGFDDFDLMRDGAPFAKFRQLPEFDKFLDQWQEVKNNEERQQKAKEAAERIAEAGSIDSTGDTAPPTASEIVDRQRQADRLERFASADSDDDDRSEAERLSEAVEIRRGLADLDRSDTETSMKLFRTAIRLGNLYRHSGRQAKAHQVWQDVLERSEQLAALNLENDALLKTLSKIQRDICNQYGQYGLWEFATYEIEANLRTGKIWNPQWDSKFLTALAAQGKFREHAEFFRLYETTYGWDHLATKTTAASDLIWSSAMNPNGALPSGRSVKIAFPLLRDFDDSILGFDRAKYLAERFRLATAFSTRQPKFALDSMMPISSKLFNYHGAAPRYWIAMTKKSAGESKLAQEWMRWGDERFAWRTRVILRSQYPVIPSWNGVRNWQTMVEDICSRRLAHKLMSPEKEKMDLLQEFWRARSLNLLGEHDLAEQVLVNARKEVTSDPQELAYFAITLAKMNRPAAEVDAAWGEATNASTNDATTWILAGRHYSEVGNHDRALAHYAKASTLCPNELNQFLEAGFWVAGRYKDSLYAFKAPQLDNDPSKPIVVTRDMKRLEQQPAPWPTAAAWNRSEISPETILGHFGKAYLVAHVYSPDERTETLQVFGRYSREQPGAVVWVNGVNVFQTDSQLSFDGIGQTVPITLRKGLNTLMIKVPLEKRKHDFSVWIALGDQPTIRDLQPAKRMRWLESAKRIDSNLDNWSGWIGDVLFVEAARLSLFDADAQFVDHFGENLAMTAICGPDTYRMHRVAEILALHGGDAFQTHRAVIQKGLEDEMDVAKGELLGYFRRVVALYRIADGDLVGAADVISSPGVGFQGMLTHCLRARVLHAQGNVDAAAESLSVAFDIVESNHQDYRMPIDHLHLMTTERLITGSTDRYEKLQTKVQDADSLYDSDIAGDTSAYDHFVASARTDEIRSHAHRLRGRRYLKLSKEAMALSEFDRAVELLPESYESHLERAIFFADTGNLPAAAKQMIAARNRCVGAPEELLPQLLARVENAAGCRPKLAAELRRRDPLSEIWLKVEIAIAFRERRWMDAINLCRAATNDINIARCELALALLMEDRALHGDALEKLMRLYGKRSPAEDVDRPEVHYQQIGRALGMAPIEDSQHEQIQTIAESALQVSKGAKNQVIAGLAALRTGDPAGAVPPLLAAAQAAFSHNAGDAGGRFGIRRAALAMAYHRMGDDEQARLWLDRCNNWIKDTQIRRSRFVAGDMDAGAFFDKAQHLASYAMIREAKLEIEGEVPEFFPLAESDDDVQP